MAKLEAIVGKVALCRSNGNVRKSIERLEETAKSIENLRSVFLQGKVAMRANICKGIMRMTF